MYKIIKGINNFGDSLKNIEEESLDKYGFYYEVIESIENYGNIVFDVRVIKRDEEGELDNSLKTSINLLNLFLNLDMMKCIIGFDEDTLCFKIKTLKDTLELGEKISTKYQSIYKSHLYLMKTEKLIGIKNNFYVLDGILKITSNVLFSDERDLILPDETRVLHKESFEGLKYFGVGRENNIIKSFSRICFGNNLVYLDDDFDCYISAMTNTDIIMVYYSESIMVMRLLLENTVRKVRLNSGKHKEYRYHTECNKSYGINVYEPYDWITGMDLHIDKSWKQDDIIEYIKDMFIVTVNGTSDTIDINIYYIDNTFLEGWNNSLEEALYNKVIDILNRISSIGFMVNEEDLKNMVVHITKSLFICVDKMFSRRCIVENMERRVIDKVNELMFKKG